MCILKGVCYWCLMVTLVVIGVERVMAQDVIEGMIVVDWEIETENVWVTLPPREVRLPGAEEAGTTIAEKLKRQTGRVLFGQI